MRRLIVIPAAIVALLCVGAIAFAHLGGGLLNSVISTCPRGTSLPDGCSGANPASVFQVPSAFVHGGLFNTLAATSTDYSTTNIGTVGVNAAGVNYPVGAFTPTVSLLDPAPTSGGSPIAGCTQGTSFPGGNPQLNCSGASFVGISGYDFKARFGHACVVLNASATVNSINITNNNFENDGNCGFAHGAGFISTIGSTPPLQANVRFNTFQGNGTAFPYDTCNGTIDATCNGSAALNSGGIVTVEYNSFVNFSARPVICNSLTGQANSFTFKYNYVQGWDYHPFNGHTEFVVCNGNGTITQHYEYNTVVQTTDAMQFGPVPIFAASTWPMDIGTITVVGNTVISSLIGGSTATATASGCIGGDPTCTTPGTNFYASAVSGSDRIGHGEELGGGQGGPVCVTPSGTLTVTNITAPVAGVSTVTVTGTPTVGLGPQAAATITMPSGSGYGTAAMAIGKVLTGIGAAGTYSVINPNTGSFSGTATATAPGASVTAWLATNLGGGQGTGSSWTIDSNTLPAGFWLAGPATCSGLLMFGTSQNGALFQANGFRHVGAATLTGNFIDSSSTFVASHSGFSIGWGGSGQGPFTASIASGTLTATTSQNLTIGNFVVGASVPGCTIDPTTCPTVVSGSGTSWTVTPAISAPSESMTAERPVVCAVPSVVSGNVDMAGFASGGVLNPDFSLAAFAHGC